MDNLTHALTGALIARTLPDRWAGERDEPLDPDSVRPGRWLTWSAVVAANLPDFEALVLWPPPLGDKAAYLLHHRGWSHSLVGIAAEAVTFTALLWLLARCRCTAGWFAGFTLRRGLDVAALGVGSHLFMDWWNSYGVRPFYPWDKTWYYGDRVFIVDPWVWLMLGGALVCGTRRFGRTKWWWYALTFAATLVVAGACWKEQCPSWVAVGWATGVIEVALLRWWGRWRFAPLIAASLIGLYLVANAYWSVQAVGAALAGPVLSQRYDSDRIDALGAMPVPGVPWRRRVMSSVMTVGPSGRDVLANVCYGDWDGLTGGYVHRDCLSRSPGEAERRGLEEDPKVIAWKAFARFHIGGWRITEQDDSTPGQEGEFVMGDARCGADADDWSELRIAVPFSGRAEGTASALSERPDTLRTIFPSPQSTPR
ncbi:metal-dependent hydrolase [Alienimonas chondri]|uniref:Metal-dependent hydrolase n=1 Tax=Alienimonas chondri TaxID=2681879 RepID=A0ABX1VDH0_9PLAN|nr:metal-dependent hydrolase [Alienimonas chondri]NNJ25565.1 hypothetical protein [Alienimonas chondri]